MAYGYKRRRMGRRRPRRGRRFRYKRRRFGYRRGRRRYNRQELKHYDLDITSVLGSIGSTWVEEALCNHITRGIGNKQRIGKQIRLRSIHIKGVISNEGYEVSSEAWDTIRIVIAKWKEQDNRITAGTGPAEYAHLTIDMPITKMDDQKNTSANLWVNPMQLQHKFLDRTMVIESILGGTNELQLKEYVPKHKLFKYYRRFRNTYIRWRSGDEDLAATRPDSDIWISMISDSTAIPHPGFIHGFIRFTYTDA